MMLYKIKLQPIQDTVQYAVLYNWKIMEKFIKSIFFIFKILIMKLYF